MARRLTSGRNLKYAGPNRGEAPYRSLCRFHAVHRSNSRRRVVVASVEHAALPSPAVTAPMRRQSAVGRAGLPLAALPARCCDRVKHCPIAEAPAGVEVQDNPRRHDAIVGVESHTNQTTRPTSLRGAISSGWTDRRCRSGAASEAFEVCRFWSTWETVPRTFDGCNKSDEYLEQQAI